MDAAYFTSLVQLAEISMLWVENCIRRSFIGQYTVQSIVVDPEDLFLGQVQPLKTVGLHDTAQQQHTHHFSSQFFNEINGCPHSSSSSQDVIQQNDLVALAYRFFLNLDHILPVFQLVTEFFAFSWQLPSFSDGVASLASLETQGGSKEEAPGFQHEYFVVIDGGQSLHEGIDDQFEYGRVGHDGKYINEIDSLEFVGLGGSLDLLTHSFVHISTLRYYINL